MKIPKPQSANKNFALTEQLSQKLSSLEKKLEKQDHSLAAHQASLSFIQEKV